jgi:mono/diheme cytochrome c family protein
MPSIHARVAAVPIVAGLLLASTGCRGHAPGAGPAFERPAVELEVRPLARSEGIAGDPANGARLYRVHCSSCHGAEGRGDGPAAAYMYPAPRDHTDPAHMNRRSDQEIHDVIAGGGSGLELSSLMPRWDEIFGDHQIWDLVAHVRGLYQPLSSVLGSSGVATTHEVVLSDALFDEAIRTLKHQLPGGARKVTYFSAEAPTSFAVFGHATLDGRPVPLAVGLDSSGRLLRVRTFPQVVLHHRGFRLARAVDRFLDGLAGQPAGGLAVPPEVPEELARVAPALAASIRELSALLALALRQDRLDAVHAAERVRASRTDPGSVTEGERLYLSACAACHGPTGKGALVPGASVPLRSRNLSDGAHLNRLSDDQILFLMACGGEKARVSPAMPSFGDAFTSEQLRAILAHVRSLARPLREAGHAP